MNVHAGTEQEMYATCARILPVDSSHPLHEFRIPGGCQGNAAHRGCGTIVANAHRAVGHLLFRQAEFFVAANVKAFDAPEQIDLLLQRHSAENGIDALFNFRIAGGSSGTLL